MSAEGSAYRAPVARGFLDNGSHPSALSPARGMAAVINFAAQK